jgi:hypothetical protein
LNGPLNTGTANWCCGGGNTSRWMQKQPNPPPSGSRTRSHHSFLFPLSFPLHTARLTQAV